MRIYLDISSFCITEETEDILLFAESLASKGIKTYDALHISLISIEPFDYTKWREQSLEEGLSVRQLSQKAMMYSENI